MSTARKPKILVVERSGHNLSSLLREEQWILTTVVNAAAALSLLKQERFQLIVYCLGDDIEEFAGALQELSPTVPTIAVTDCGQDDAAVRALRLGAASYVPHGDASRNLNATAERLVALTGDAYRHRFLMGVIVESRQQFSIDNDLTLVAAIVVNCREMLDEMTALSESDRLRVSVALDEALHNAVIHGNLEVSSRHKEGDPGEFAALVDERRQQSPFANRRVELSISIASDAVRFVVRDEGPGFDPSTLPDPTDPENLIKPHGRGLLLIHTFMDEVEINETGNEIRMTKHLRR